MTVAVLQCSWQIGGRKATFFCNYCLPWGLDINEAVMTVMRQPGTYHSVWLSADLCSVFCCMLVCDCSIMCAVCYVHVNGQVRESKPKTRKCPPRVRRISPFALTILLLTVNQYALITTACLPRCSLCRSKYHDRKAWDSVKIAERGCQYLTGSC